MPCRFDQRAQCKDGPALCSIEIRNEPSVKPRKSRGIQATVRSRKVNMRVLVFELMLTTRALVRMLRSTCNIRYFGLRKRPGSAMLPYRGKSYTAFATQCQKSSQVSIWGFTPNVSLSWFAIPRRSRRGRPLVLPNSKSSNMPGVTFPLA